MEGTVLDGRYRVDALIAKGGMSTVYAGMDLRLDRKVAIKVMRSDYVGDPSFLTRFEREARAAAGLHHPGVVAVFDQGRDGDSVFLVMELIDGGTLRDLLRQQGALTVPVTLSILEPVLSALAAAHDAGLVHRDVKPENVLISSRGDVKVADFGLVRAVTSTTMATGDVILGTVAYLSPEQVSTGYSDARSDVYSAGILAFEMLTGAPPYSGDTAISVAYRHVNSDCPAPSSRAPGVPQALDRILVAATSRDANKRQLNAGALLAEIVRARARLNIRRVPVPVPTHPVVAIPAAGPSGTQVLPVAHSRDTLVAEIAPDRSLVEAKPATDTVSKPDTANKMTSEQPREAVPPDAPTTDRAIVQRRRKRRRTWIVVVLIVILASAAAVTGWWLGAGRWTAVPSLIGVTQDSAVQAAQSADLVPVVSSKHDNSTPAGRVSGVDPKEGARQLRGSTIQIVVSTGRPVVPAISSGITTAAALQAIKDADLVGVVDPAEAVFDQKIASGLVVSTVPAAGQAMDIGGAVHVITSKGKAPVAVPTVADKSVADAVNALKVAGLAVGDQVAQFDPARPAGTVIGTTPAAGKSVDSGSTVQLLVSNSLLVPTIAGASQADAAAALTTAGLTLAAGETTFDAGVDGGHVISSTPAAGTLVDPASPTVTVTISNAITMPKTVGRNIDDAARDLTAAGLKVQVSSFFGFGSQIRSQDPAAGTRVAPGTTVKVSAGP